MNYAKTALLLAVLTALFMGMGYLMGGAAGAFIALLIAMGMNAFAFWNSDKMALRMHNARAATRQSHPELFDMVEELSRNADLPMPAIYVIEEDQPNAFATGRDPSNAAVAATTGIMRLLTRDELAGVMAHELAHIKNRDTLIMTIAATVGGAISMMAQFGLWFGRGNDRGPLGLVGVIAAALLAPFAATLVQMTISRTREYAADRMGAEIARDPLALASALRKISGGVKRSVMESAERAPATAHMFIFNPLTRGGVDNLFSTHPNVENRIKALTDMAADYPKAEMRPSRIPTIRREP
ncbi:heat shock protein HtpX [Rubricella aquisinus]|uniref:Protease HtpX homolog n=1 Tax=Rubricella aquisinus TaxID=2028108 RepID=A0A840WK52_9RHOB|nr:zinc metalloprotease HtpX [Rubricella aquisinus]MBB5515439.1 heat shock protein HtpX [Rubricella aquisinus]